MVGLVDSILVAGYHWSRFGPAKDPWPVPCSVSSELVVRYCFGVPDCRLLVGGSDGWGDPWPIGPGPVSVVGCVRCWDDPWPIGPGLVSVVGCVRCSGSVLDLVLVGGGVVWMVAELVGCSGLIPQWPLAGRPEW